MIDLFTDESDDLLPFGTKRANTPVCKKCPETHINMCVNGGVCYLTENNLAGCW